MAPAAVGNHSSLLGVKYGERNIIMYSSRFRNNVTLEWVNVYLYATIEGQTSDIISIHTVKGRII